MLNVVSILIGIVAAVLMLPGLIPLLGWLNWFMLPVAAVGIVVGMLSSRTSGRNLNIAVFAIGVIRLMLGGGIF